MRHDVCAWHVSECVGVCVCVCRRRFWCQGGLGIRQGARIVILICGSLFGVSVCVLSFLALAGNVLGHEGGLRMGQCVCV